MSIDNTARTLPSGAVIDDKRTPEERAATRFLAVATDRFMSGWGSAPGRSIFALACTTLAEAETCADNLGKRSDMTRVRIVEAPYRPHLRDGDHLSISGRSEAERHYLPGGF